MLHATSIQIGEYTSATAAIAGSLRKPARFSKRLFPEFGMAQISSRVEDRPPHGIPCDRRRSILIEFRLVVALLQLASGLLQVLRRQIQVAHTVCRTSESHRDR